MGQGGDLAMSHMWWPGGLRESDVSDLGKPCVGGCTGAYGPVRGQGGRQTGSAGLRQESAS